MRRLLIALLIAVIGCGGWTSTTAAVAPGTMVTVHTRSHERIVGEVSDQTADALVVEGRRIQKRDIESVEAKFEAVGDQDVVESPAAGQPGNTKRARASGAIATGVAVTVGITIGIVLLLAGGIAIAGVVFAAAGAL